MWPPRVPTPPATGALPWWRLPGPSAATWQSTAADPRRGRGDGSADSTSCTTTSDFPLLPPWRGEKGNWKTSDPQPLAGARFGRWPRCPPAATEKGRERSRRTWGLRGVLHDRAKRFGFSLVGHRGEVSRAPAEQGDHRILRVRVNLNRRVRRRGRTFRGNLVGL